MFFFVFFGPIKTEKKKLGRDVLFLFLLNQEAGTFLRNFKTCHHIYIQYSTLATPLAQSTPRGAVSELAQNTPRHSTPAPAPTQHTARPWHGQNPRPQPAHRNPRARQSSKTSARRRTQIHTQTKRKNPYARNTRNGCHHNCPFSIFRCVFRRGR